MIILVQRKYSIYTKFLDTILQSEDVIREGETRQDAMSRVRRELDATADEWRKEAIINETIREAEEQSPPIGPPKPSPVIDYKKWDQFEIRIENAQSAEELQALIDLHNPFPGKFLSLINAKRQLLKTTS